MKPMPQENAHFRGLRIAALESRNAAEMARLIEKFGGQPFVSPSMREVPIEQNREAIDFAHRLITGEIDVMIFLTGVGFRHLLAAVERHVERQRYLHALSDITTICRGPKPVAAMAEVTRPREWIAMPRLHQILDDKAAPAKTAKQLLPAVQEFQGARLAMLAAFHHLR